MIWGFKPADTHSRHGKHTARSICLHRTHLLDEYIGQIIFRCLVNSPVRTSRLRPQHVESTHLLYDRYGHTLHRNMYCSCIVRS
jgi:hypothetical protein